ncbi:MAG: prepilin-type N-terminal cleavage/methylation domain-containing protein, partial [Desulfobacterales bacterium]|nr:prepilin-type N-terminal cleavage/methylation domain-containing protein [Desulfobacterales bacterium]
MNPVLTDNKGVSLLELLVVLSILGFAAAIVAPRFAGITAEAVDTAGRMNEARLIKYITTFLQDHGNYPTGLVNLVSTDRLSGQFFKPEVSDQDPDN